MRDLKILLKETWKTKKILQIGTLYLVFLFINLQLYGNEKPLPISLGTGCRVAYVLKHNNIRTFAYPFDWVWTPFESLYQVLNEDFANFFSKEDFIMSPFNSASVLNTYTGISFYHDFPLTKDSMPNESEDGDEGFGDIGFIASNFLDAYKEIHEKYLRRINRFREVLNSSKNVLLMRFEATKEEAILLRDFFATHYPRLIFTIIIINCLNPLDGKPWNIDKIKNYYVPLNQHLNPICHEWKDILKKLNLLP